MNSALFGSRQILNLDVKLNLPTNIPKIVSKLGTDQIDSIYDQYYNGSICSIVDGWQ